MEHFPSLADCILLGKLNGWGHPRCKEILVPLPQGKPQLPQGVYSDLHKLSNWCKSKWIHVRRSRLRRGIVYDIHGYHQSYSLPGPTCPPPAPPLPGLLPCSASAPLNTKITFHSMHCSFRWHGQARVNLCIGAGKCDVVVKCFLMASTSAEYAPPAGMPQSIVLLGL